MNIRQTTLKTPQTYNSSTPKPSTEATTAPAGDSFSFSRLDGSDLKDIVGFTALGALGGAIGGKVGNGLFTTTLATAAASAAVDTAGAYIDSEITQDPWGGLNVALSPIVGGVAGTAGGLLGLGLSAATGMGPTMAGAVGGGVAHFGLSTWGAVMS